MAKQLYVKLQTATIELPISAKDPSGAKDTIIVGFKRGDTKTTGAVLESFSKASDIYVRMLYGQPLEGKVTDEDKETEEYTSEEVEKAMDGISNIIKENIIYLKNASCVVVDSEASGKPIDLQVNDTRKAKPTDFWANEEECLDALLELYLLAMPWKSAFSIAFNKALINMDTTEERTKN